MGERERAGPAPVDLHIHTTASDGDFSPTQVVMMAVRAGLGTVAITDHNTLGGVEEAIRAGVEHGLAVISGVEVSANYGELELHLLGYFVDWRDRVLRRRLAESEQEFVRVYAGRAGRMRTLGFRVEDADVLELRPDGSYMLKSLLDALLYHDREGSDPRLDPYRKGDLAARLAFLRAYQQPGGPGHAPMAMMAVEEAIDLVRRAGGVPVLAHPGTILGEGESPAALEPLLRKLAERGLAGVEAYSSYHPPASAHDLHALARRLGLGVTAGSDYHGPRLKPGLELGSVTADSREVLKWLLDEATSDGQDQRGNGDGARRDPQDPARRSEPGGPPGGGVAPGVLARFPGRPGIRGAHPDAGDEGGR
ncbi:MAG TPA: PHP domain-containing protein [Bacillota bacterium]|nr:PHP domain-containing protein [Bacillota bacterium]